MIRDVAEAEFVPSICSCAALVGTALDLSLECDIDSVDNRFRAQCSHFRRSDQHTMLIFRMYEDALDDDAELRQITGLDGLSVVLFAKSPVDGYDNIVISKKGGKSA